MIALERFLVYHDTIHPAGDLRSFTVEPRFNEPLFNEVLDITNKIVQPGQSYSKMYRKQPRYNEILDLTNTTP